MFKLITLAIPLLVTIYTADAGCALFGNCGYGGNIILGITTFLSSQFVQHFEILQTSEDINFGCRPIFKWDKVKRNRLVLRVGINKKFYVNLVKKTSKADALAAIRRALAKWEKIPERDCDYDFNLKFRIIDNDDVERRVTKKLGLCYAEKIDDNSIECSRDEILIDNKIDLYIAGFASPKYFDKIEENGGKRIAGITLYFNEDDKLLSITSDDIKKHTVKNIDYAEIYFNNGFKWAVIDDGKKIPKKTLDVESVALHEIGDALIYKTNQDRTLHEFLDVKGKRFRLENTAVSNPFLGVVAKQKLLDYDTELFCDAFAPSNTPDNGKVFQRNEESYTNDNSNNNNNDNNSNFKDNTGGNNIIAQYGFTFAVLISLLLIVNICVTIYSNISKPKKNKANEYRKVEMVTTESETDINNI